VINDEYYYLKQAATCFVAVICLFHCSSEIILNKST
jgi:hypothetical protein